MTRRPQQDDPVPGPVYLRIARDLRERIVTGQLGPGDQLPTEQELVEAYGTASRYPARQAIAQLVGEGLVITKRPQGSFVRSRQRLVYRPQEEFEPAPSADMDRFLGRLTAEGRTPTQTIEVSVAKPPPRLIAERLQADAAALRRRTRSIDGEPYHTNDSYFPLDLVRDSEIMLPVDIARGARQVLAELGAEEQWAVDEIVGRMPTYEETSRLELPPASPVIEHICTAYDRGGRPVRCTWNVLAADRHTVTYERRRPE